MYSVCHENKKNPLTKAAYPVQGQVTVAYLMSHMEQD